MNEQPDLAFDNSSPEQILPHNGEAIYHGPILDSSESRQHLDHLIKQIPWKRDEVVLFGKRIVTDRKVAWYGDKNYDYTYSGETKTALEWTPELLALKKKVEQVTGARYNSCLLNFYANGNEGMGWHQDNERSLGINPNIAALSFGAKRRFDFRDKDTREKVSIKLEEGSLLEMKGTTQAHWQHQLPKTKKVLTPRVSLTFRLIT